jgi:hypothetical protein
LNFEFYNYLSMKLKNVTQKLFFYELYLVHKEVPEYIYLCSKIYKIAIDI